jgi:hypothetical protein
MTEDIFKFGLCKKKSPYNSQPDQQQNGEENDEPDSAMNEAAYVGRKYCVRHNV